ncbi:MAG TPA: RHS repeat-associated core domain-containing protein [Acidobacteriaceae bacterium]|jgi:RHS repeat-associated protein|nr:RHS repeat-associated core domain-containing protein [Acidobacteriaceae bacterium]
MISAGRLSSFSVLFIGNTALAASIFATSLAAQAPLPSNSQVDSGIHPFGTYDGFHDSVSVGSGNLSFCIPLVSLPGLIKHDLNIPLCYNNQFEEPGLSTTAPAMYPVTSWFPWVWGTNTPKMGPGWTLTGRIGVYTAPANGQVIFMPDGGKYILPSTQSNGLPLNYGPDWSGGNLFINAPQTWIYQKNGTRSTASVSTTTQEYDSYGSLITFTPTSVTDTVGRTVTVSASAANGASPATLSFQYPDSNGVTRTVTVPFITVTNTCGAGVDTDTKTYYGSGGTTSMPSAVILPDGLTYTFQYDACGNLNKVTYPSGGYTRYAYALEGVAVFGEGTGESAPSWHPYEQNEVVAKYVCPAPSVTLGATTAAPGDTCSVPEEATTYAPTEAFSNTGNTGNKVTDPMGNYVVYQFTQANIGWYVPSLESSRVYYNSAGSVLKSVQTTYNCLCSNSPMPTLPQTQTTTFANGSGSLVQWTYNLEPLSQTDSPLLEKQEYDFGPGGTQTLLRTTKYDWLQLDNPSVYGWNIGTTGAHILDRVTKNTVYNASGTQVAQTTYQYDYGAPVGSDLGFLTQVSRWNSSGGSSLVSSSIWGAAGGVTQTTDPNGNITKYSYTDNYADGINRNSGAYPTTIQYITATKTYVEQKQYYWGSGLIAASCGENFSGTCKTGLSSVADYASFSYDLMNRNVATSTGDGGHTTTCYSEVAGSGCSTGAFPLEVTSTEAVSTSGVVKKATQVFDGEGKVTQTQLNSDPSCNGSSYVNTTYDADGRVSTKSNPFCTTGDSTYGATTYNYDGLSRVTQATNPDGTSKSNTYVGRAVLSTDEGNGTVALQRVTQTDSLGRLTNVCDVSNTTQQGTSNQTPSACNLDYSDTGFLTSYTYDPMGDLLSVTQGGETRGFSYDSFSRLISATNPESGTTTYGYDNNGNLTRKTSAIPITTTYTYDALNRLTGKSYSDGITPAACFQYDQGTNGIGRLSTEWTQAGTCAATPPTSGLLTERTLAAYDLMGRVTTDKQCSSPGNCTGTPYTVNYGYDLAGDIDSFTNGLAGTSAMSFSNVYDSAGRLSTVVGPTTAGASSEPLNLFTALGYNAAGAIVNAQIGPGIALQRSYNKRLLPVSETDQVATTPGTATIQITGAEQSSGSTTGSIIFSGTEQSEVYEGAPDYDAGSFIISINGGAAIQVSYGESSTPQSIAASLASVIGCAYGPVKAVAVGATVNLTSCTSGAGTNYSISAYLNGHTSIFSKASFAVTTSGSTMTLPPATFATGTIFIGGAWTEMEVLGVFFEPNQYGGPVTIGTPTSITPAALASALAAEIPPCSANQYFSAVANGPAIDLTSCTAGPGGNYAIATSGGGSLTMTASGPTLTGGESLAGVYDSGTVNLTINGVQIASAPYDAGSTPTSIASALVTSGSGNSLVTLTSNGANLTMVAQAAYGDGTYSDYTYALTVDYDTAQFTAPSFSASSTAGSLAGGENAPLYSWAINTYAPDGDVVSMTDSVMGTWTYTYDDHNRLVTGDATAGSFSGLDLSWNYDQYGNRWNQNASGSGSAVQTHFTFSGNNNRIDQYSTNYDADGNLKADGVNTYTYDAENRINTVNGQATYLYDAEGTRVAKLGSGGAVSSVYILGLGHQQLTEVNASGQWAHSNVFTSGGRLLATYEGPGGPAHPGYHYHLTDWLGTKRVQTNSTGNLDLYCFSYPFGDGLTCDGLVDATEQHFTGKERDTESGLDYFGARYLSSNFGRFMTPDWAAASASVPYANFANPQSLNLYVYVGNNPNTGVDADGHFMNEPTGASEVDAAMQANDEAFGTQYIGWDGPSPPPDPDSDSDSSSGGSGQQQTTSTKVVAPNQGAVAATEKENIANAQCVVAVTPGIVAGELLKAAKDAQHEAVKSVQEADATGSVPKEPSPTTGFAAAAAIINGPLEAQKDCIQDHPGAVLSPNYPAGAPLPERQTFFDKIIAFIDKMI